MNERMVLEWRKQSREEERKSRVESREDREKACLRRNLASGQPVLNFVTLQKIGLWGSLWGHQWTLKRYTMTVNRIKLYSSVDFQCDNTFGQIPAARNAEFVPFRLFPKFVTPPLPVFYLETTPQNSPTPTPFYRFLVGKRFSFDFLSKIKNFLRTQIIFSIPQIPPIETRCIIS